MLVEMVDIAQEQTLGAYIREHLGHRSVRALAEYAGIGVATAHRLVNDQVENPDAPTLQKVAEYLHIPVENLYRLAGYLPDEDESLRNALIREAEHLLKQLPEESQREFVEMLRVMHRLRTERERKEAS